MSLAERTELARLEADARALEGTAVQVAFLGVAAGIGLVAVAGRIRGHVTRRREALELAGPEHPPLAYVDHGTAFSMPPGATLREPELEGAERPAPIPERSPWQP